VPTEEEELGLLDDQLLVGAMGVRFEREQTTAEGLDDDGAGHLDRLVRAILPAALGVGSGTLLLVLVVPRIVEPEWALSFDNGLHQSAHTLANINKT
jgi:hypothetical protein